MTTTSNAPQVAINDIGSAEDLLAEAWDENADPFTNSPRVTVSHLRKKLGEPRIVHTVAGAGYYVAEEER